MSNQIEIDDDGKGKYQSFTATAKDYLWGANSNYSVDLSAYGETEEEARANMDISIERLSVYLNTIHSKPVAPVSVVTLEQVEIVSESIYWQWASREGFVPWVKGGNSLKQDEARSIAWSTLDKVKELDQ